MTDFIMEIIPEPPAGTASVLVFGKKGKHAFIKGTGEDNYLCGTCRNVLCEKITRGQVQNLVFKCPNCDSYNFIR